MPHIFEIPYLTMAVGGVITFALCLLLVVSKDWHGALTFDLTVGVQKIHIHPTPRVGGVAIFMGLAGAWFFAPYSISKLLGPLIVSCLPAFLFGFAEDISKRVGVIERLLATMASGLLACYLSEMSLPRLNVWGVDTLMAFWPVSVAFTIFAVSGVINAVNIIDGFNGLASGTIVICMASIGLMAYQAGDPALAQLCFVLVAVTVGFMVMNFPFGKIFLGDGGAYLLGFALAWTTVLLLARNSSVSAWAPLLACCYPVLEVGFSVLRRRARAVSPASPDRLHLHSLVKARITRKKFPHVSPSIKNAMVSPLLWLCSLVPACFASVFFAQTPWLIAGFVMSAVFYAFFYARLINFRWCIPRLVGGWARTTTRSA